MKKFTLHRFVCFFLLAGLLAACTPSFLEEDPPNDPVTNFEILWREFDAFYGQFEAKYIQWDSLHTVYRARVTPLTTDAELYTVMTKLLAHLNDSHVILANPRNPDQLFYSGVLNGRTRNDFFLKTVTGHYLSGTGTGNGITYGKLSDKIGYMHFAHFDASQQYYADIMLKMLEELAGIEKLVIDVRDNTGGNDAAAQLVANRFAAGRNLYMVTRRKTGPAHNDFGAGIEWYTEPKGGKRFAGPIALLTNRWTISTGETFVLAMRTNAHVTQIGDTTTGAFSDVRNFVLPNGFYTKIPGSDVRDREGKSWEGIGIAPHLLVENTRQELENGKDAVLEKAMAVLE